MLARFSLLCLITLISLTCIALASSDDTSFGDSEAVKETLRTIDYLPEILSMKPEPPGNLEQLHWGFYRKYDPSAKDLDVSEAEERFFKVYRSDNDYAFSFQRTISNILDCYHETGVIPDNGFELIEFVSGKRTFDPTVSRLVAMGPNKDVKTYLRIFPSVFNMVNPATGRFIDSFKQQEWVPFGICITELNEVPESYFYSDPDGNSIDPNSLTVLNVRLYGDTEGEVLYDKIVSSYRIRD